MSSKKTRGVSHSIKDDNYVYPTFLKQGEIEIAEDIAYRYLEANKMIDLQRLIKHQVLQEIATLPFNIRRQVNRILKRSGVANPRMAIRTKLATERPKPTVMPYDVVKKKRTPKDEY